MSRMHKQSPRSIYTKLSTAPLKTHSAKLTLAKSLSRVRHIYGNPSGGYGTCEGISPKWITDQITDQIIDQNTPYCYELGTTAINKIRVLAACWRRAGTSTSHLLRQIAFHHKNTAFWRGNHLRLPPTFTIYSLIWSEFILRIKPVHSTTLP